MEFNNIFTMNDWKFKDFTITMIFIQVLMWIVGIISSNSIHIPVFNDIITLLYLGFVPGIIILRILKLHDLGNTFTTLLSVGLSIISVLLIGLFMNQVYPWFGITKPIENIPLLITFTIYNMFLLVISYFMDSDYHHKSSSKLSFELLTSNQFLCLCLLPLIAIIGAYTLQYYDNNKIQILLLILICILVLSMAWGYLKKEYYHLAIFSIALSILYYSVLISNHIWGYDIFFEYQFATYVIKNGIWDYTWPHAYNAMLSVVMYAPIYSKLSGMTLTWVLKFIYPFLFSLISIGLYKIFEKHTGSKIAFLAAFFFIAYNGFSYGWMVQMARQQIAEIFLVLLVWLMIDRKIPQNKRKFLYLLFGIGLIVSHYSVTYLFMFMLLATIITLTLLGSSFGNIINTILIKFGAEKRYFGKYFKIKDQTISLPLSLFFIGFIIVYYSLTADSKPIASLFDALRIVTKNISSLMHGSINPMLLVAGIGVLIIILVVGYKIFKKISKDINPESIKSYPKIKNNILKLKQMSLKRKQALIVLVTIIAILHIWWPFRYMNIVSINAQRVILLSVYFIIIGFIMNIIRPNYFHFTREYNTFAIFNMVILACGLFIPSFRDQLSLQRIYEVTFVVLAPFCVMGLYHICNSAIGLIKHVSLEKRTKTTMKIIGIFMVLFFILNTGLIDLEVGQSSTLPLDNTIDAPIFSQGEYAGVAWFNNYHTNEDNETVYSDAFSNILLYWLNDIRTTNPKNMSDMSPGSYLFLRSHNIGHESFLYGSGSYIPISEGLYKSSKIYDNGDSQIYKRVIP